MASRIVDGSTMATMMGRFLLISALVVLDRNELCLQQTIISSSSSSYEELKELRLRKEENVQQKVCPMTPHPGQPCRNSFRKYAEHSL